MKKTFAAVLSVTAAVMMMAPLAQAETNSLGTEHQSAWETIKEMARNHPDQIRVFADQEEHVIEIMSPVTGLCLGIAEGVTDNGAPVTQVPCDTEASRLIVPDADSEGNESAFIIAHNRKCLDIPDADVNNGVHLQQWDCDDVPQQRFAFPQAPARTFAIQPVHTLNNPNTTPKCLIAEGEQVRSGAITQGDCLDDKGQFLASARFMAFLLA